MNIFLLTVFCTVFIQPQDFSAAVRLGSFTPQSAKNNNFASKATEYEVEMHYKLNDEWLIWANSNYVYKKTKTLALENPLTFCLIPISAGVHYEYPCLDFFAPYVGIGLSCTYASRHEKILSKQSAHDSWITIGQVIKTGLSLLISEEASFNIYADYYTGTQRSYFHGWRSGAGIRINFDPY